jgi:hypothetical protein
MGSFLPFQALTLKSIGAVLARQDAWVAPGSLSVRGDQNQISPRYKAKHHRRWTSNSRQVLGEFEFFLVATWPTTRLHDGFMLSGCVWHPSVAERLGDGKRQNASLTWGLLPAIGAIFH